jgi:Flp pilus assembly protein TadD
MGAVYSTRGVAYQKRRQNDLAIADLDMAVKLDPKKRHFIAQPRRFPSGAGRI